MTSHPEECCCPCFSSNYTHTHKIHTCMHIYIYYSGAYKLLSKQLQLYQEYHCIIQNRSLIYWNISGQASLILTKLICTFDEPWRPHQTLQQGFNRGALYCYQEHCVTKKVGLVLTPHNFHKIYSSMVPNMLWSIVGDTSLQIKMRQDKWTAAFSNAMFFTVLQGLNTMLANWQISSICSRFPSHHCEQVLQSTLYLYCMNGGGWELFLLLYFHSLSAKFIPMQRPVVPKLRAHRPWGNPITADGLRWEGRL